MDAKAKLLLVEDDVNLGASTQRRLEEYGFSVVHCADAETAWIHFKSGKFDICLIDIILPRKNGLELTRQIRECDKSIPVFFLTSRSSNEDKINGFEQGGDVYLTKPFPIQELILRIEVWLKRGQSVGLRRNNLYKTRDILFDYDEHTIFWGKGKKTYLTERMAQLLKFYLDNPNRFLSREEILLNVWGKNDYFIGRSMDVYNTKIRKFFPKDHKVLVSSHGRGFTFIVKDLEVTINGELVRVIPDNDVVNKRTLSD